MSQLTRGLKRRIGDVLIKLLQGSSLTAEDKQIALILESKGMAKFYGPPRGPRKMPAQEVLDYQHLSAMSYFALTGLGSEFILSYSEKRLLAGRFLLPGETPWYDQWPWKLVWPAIVAILTTLFINALKESSK